MMPNRTEALLEVLGRNERWSTCWDRPTEAQHARAMGLIEKWVEEDKWKTLERCWCE